MGRDRRPLPRGSACPLCEDDGDAREAIEARDGVVVCVWHALAFDLDQDDMRSRVAAIRKGDPTP